MRGARWLRITRRSAAFFLVAGEGAEFFRISAEVAYEAGHEGGTVSAPDTARGMTCESYDRPMVIKRPDELAKPRPSVEFVGQFRDALTGTGPSSRRFRARRSRAAEMLVGVESKRFVGCCRQDQMADARLQAGHPRTVFTRTDWRRGCRLTAAGVPFRSWWC